MRAASALLRQFPTQGSSYNKWTDSKKAAPTSTATPRSTSTSAVLAISYASLA